MNAKCHLWGVVSDSHGDRGALSNIMLMLEYKSVEGIIHLGDGYLDIEPFETAFPRGAYRVKGNCDLYGEENEQEIMIGGVRIFITHGHRYHVKQNTDYLWMEAAAREAKAALFGHTHEQHMEERGGILLMNPGSASEGRYALLRVYEGGLVEAELC